MRTYYGFAATQDLESNVTVRDSRSPKQLTHHLRHSPGGFTWGKDSQGCSELGRCILLDSFGSRSCPDAPGDCKCNLKWVEPYYQAFGGDVISKFSESEDWHLSQVEVLDWTFDHLKVDQDEDEDTLLAV